MVAHGERKKGHGAGVLFVCRPCGEQVQPNGWLQSRAVGTAGRDGARKDPDRGAIRCLRRVADESAEVWRIGGTRQREGTAPRCFSRYTQRVCECARGLALCVGACLCLGLGFWPRLRCELDVIKRHTFSLVVSQRSSFQQLPSATSGGCQQHATQ